MPDGAFDEQDKSQADERKRREMKSSNLSLRLFALPAALSYSPVSFLTYPASASSSAPASKRLRFSAHAIVVEDCNDPARASLAAFALHLLLLNGAVIT